MLNSSGHSYVGNGRFISIELSWRFHRHRHLATDHPPLARITIVEQESDLKGFFTLFVLIFFSLTNQTINTDLPYATLPLLSSNIHISPLASQSPFQSS